MLPAGAGGGFDCGLCPASRVRALPGRPETGKLDSAWLAKITGRGSLAGSFVPPEGIRVLRTRTGCRRHLVQERAAEKSRCGKLPEGACLELRPVITGVRGVSGREMLTAIIAGQRGPGVLAQMARTRMRGRIPRLGEAPDCAFFTGDHAFILRMMPGSIGRFTARIGVLDDKTAGLCQPYGRQIARLDDVPGYGIATARDLIAGTGVGMSVFPAAGHLCSRGRQAPGVRESGGRRKGKDATGRGSPCLAGAPGGAAVDAGRTRAFPGTRYRGLCTRMPGKKAQGAISRTRLVITRALLSGPGARYEDLGTGYCQQRAGIRRRVRNHVRGLEGPGLKVILEAPGPGTGEYLPIATAS